MPFHLFSFYFVIIIFSHIVPSHFPTLPPPPPLVCVGLTSEGDGQGKSDVPDWLEEVEEGGSDWLNGFVTFLYGLINPLEEEQEEHSVSGGLVEAPEEEDDDEEEEEVDEGFRKRGAHDDGSRGQKIVIVGLQNQ